MQRQDVANAKYTTFCVVWMSYAELPEPAPSVSELLQVVTTQNTVKLENCLTE